MQLTPLPLALVWWQRRWRPDIWEAAAEVVFAGHPSGGGCRPSSVGGWPGAAERGRGVRGGGGGGTALTSEGLLSPGPGLASPSAFCAELARGSSRQKVLPSSLAAGCLGGDFSLTPQANASVARTSATFQARNLRREIRAIKKHWDGGEGGPGYQ